MVWLSLQDTHKVKRAMKNKTRCLLKFIAFFTGFHVIYFFLIWKFPLLKLSEAQAYKFNEFLVSLGNANNIEAYYDVFDIVFILTHAVISLLILVIFYFIIKMFFYRYQHKE